MSLALSSTHPSAFLSLSRAAASKWLFLCSSCLLCFSWIFKKKNKKPTYWGHLVRLMGTLVYQNISTIFISLDWSNRRRSFIRKLKIHKKARMLQSHHSATYMQCFCTLKLHPKENITCVHPHTHTLSPSGLIFIILGNWCSKAKSQCLNNWGPEGTIRKAAGTL